MSIEQSLRKKSRTKTYHEYYRFLARRNLPEKMKPIRRRSRYKFSWGGRGGAKSYSYAKELILRGDKKKIAILCLRENMNSIADSVYADLVDVIERYRYTNYQVAKTEIRNKKTGTVFKFWGMYMQGKKQSIKSFSKFDIVWGEEASAFSKESLRILVPTIRRTGSELWFSFNRRLPDDPIWELKEKIAPGRKIEIFINIEDNQFVSSELWEEYQEDKKLFEAGLNIDFPHVWGGEPCGYSDDAIFTIDEVHGAVNRVVDDEGDEEVGADIARSGKNETVFYKRKGMKVTKRKAWATSKIDEICDNLVDFVNGDRAILIKIDDSGVGGGVTDFMRRYRYNAIGINNGSKAIMNDKYDNRISEMWYHLKSIINEVSLPDIASLKNQLLTRLRKINDSKARRRIESKDDYIKRGHKSPDDADALLLCFAPTELLNYTVNIGDRT